MAVCDNPENKIGIGYLENKDSWLLSSKYFPSKVRIIYF